MVSIKQYEYHRNGVGGAPFYSIIFTDTENDGKTFHASLFYTVDASENIYTNGHCAVHCLDMLSKENITFGENSWRGDYYEGKLVREIEKLEKKG